MTQRQAERLVNQKVVLALWGICIIRRIGPTGTSIKLKKGERKVLHMRRNNPHAPEHTGEWPTGKVPEGPEVIDDKLSMIYQYMCINEYNIYQERIKELWLPSWDNERTRSLWASQQSEGTLTESCVPPQIWRLLLDCYNHLHAIQHSHIRLRLRTENQKESCLRLDKAPSNLVWPQSWSCLEQEIALKSPWGPFQQKLAQHCCSQLTPWETSNIFKHHRTGTRFFPCLWSHWMVAEAETVNTWEERLKVWALNISSRLGAPLKSNCQILAGFAAVTKK